MTVITREEVRNRVLLHCIAGLPEQFLRLGGRWLRACWQWWYSALQLKTWSGSEFFDDSSTSVPRKKKSKITRTLTAAKMLKFADANIHDSLEQTIRMTHKWHIHCRGANNSTGNSFPDLCVNDSDHDNYGTRWMFVTRNKRNWRYLNSSLKKYLAADMGRRRP